MQTIPRRIGYFDGQDFDMRPIVSLTVSWRKRKQPGKSNAVMCKVDFRASFVLILSTPLPAGAARDSTDKSRVLLGLSKN